MTAPAVAERRPRLALTARLGRHAVTGAAAAGAVAFAATRLVRLDRFPPFVDEVTYAGWALQGLARPERRFASLTSQVEPMAIWIGTVFMRLGFDPLTAMRLVSLAAAVATLLAVVGIGLRVGRLPVALLAGGLYVLLPFFVVHDAIGILDPLVAATAALALLLQLRLADSPRLDTALLLGFAFAVGLLTKPTGLYALALLPVSLLCFDWGRVQLARRLAAWSGYAALAVALGLLGHSITRLSEWYVPLFSPRASAPRTTRPVGDALAQPWHWVAQAWPDLQDALVGYVTVPLLALALFGAVRLARGRLRLALVLAAWTALPVAADLLVSREQYSRLILSAMPPLVVFCALGAVGAWRLAGARLPSGTARWAPPAAACLVLLPALVRDAQLLASPATARYPGLDDWQFATGWPSGAPWDDVAATLRGDVGRRRVSVALVGYSETLPLLLRDEHNVGFVDADVDGAASTDYAVANGGSFPPQVDRSTLRVIGRWSRPRGGDPTLLLRRGITWKGSFYTSPARLRDALGLPDARFDAFLASHPLIGRWYHEVLDS